MSRTARHGTALYRSVTPPVVPPSARWLPMLLQARVGVVSLMRMFESTKVLALAVMKRFSRCPPFAAEVERCLELRERSAPRPLVFALAIHERNQFLRDHGADAGAAPGREGSGFAQQPTSRPRSSVFASCRPVPMLKGSENCFPGHALVRRYRPQNRIRCPDSQHAVVGHRDSLVRGCLCIQNDVAPALVNFGIAPVTAQRFGKTLAGNIPGSVMQQSGLRRARDAGGFCRDGAHRRKMPQWRL